MKIQKITNINFQNRTKTSVAKRLLYSAVAATALIASAPKANAQNNIIEHNGQKYVSYSNYLYWKQQRDDLGADKHSAHKQSSTTFEEIQKGLILFNDFEGVRKE